MGFVHINFQWPAIMRAQQATRRLRGFYRGFQIVRHNSFLEKRGPMGKKNLGEASGLSQTVLSSAEREQRDYFFLATVFFAAGFLAAAFFAGAFLAAGFFLTGIDHPPFPLATAKISENHVNNSLHGVNSSLAKIRQRISLIFA